MRIFAAEYQQNRFDLALYGAAIFYTCLTLVLATAPSIDVWEFLQISSRAILDGKNPYSIEYPLGFAGQYAPFPYPPAVVYFLAPFYKIFGDVRFGFLFVLLTSSYLGLVAKSKNHFRFLAATALLLFPSTVHVLEQSWTDLFTLLPIALIAYSRRSGNSVLFYIGTILLPLVKTYNFVLVPFLLLEKYGTKQLAKAMLVSLLTIALLVAHFSAFCPHNEPLEEFLKRMISPSFLMTEIRHFSLYDWIQAKGLILPTRITYLVSLALIVAPFFMAFLRRLPISGFFWGSFSLMSIFLLYPNTALNYIWIAYAAYFFHSFSRPTTPSSPIAITWIDFPTLIFGIVRIVMIFAIPSHLSDTGYYYEIAKSFLVDSSIWHVIQKIEYPPLAIIPIVFPTIFGSLAASHESVYRMLFLLLPILADIILFMLVKRSVGGKRAILYTLFTFFLAELIYDRIDIFVALIIAIPLTIRINQRHSFIRDLLLTIGAFFKIVPIIFSGLPGIEKNPSIKNWTLSLLVPVSAFLILILICSQDGELPKFMSYHLTRGVQVESMMGNIALILKKTGLFPGMEIITNFGAQHIQFKSSKYVLFAKTIAFATIFGTYFWILIQAWRGRRPPIVLMFTTLLCAFLASSSILSPQFLIWLIPLFLIKSNVSRGELSLLMIASAITGLHFHYYWDYIAGNSLGLLAIFFRNTILCLLFAIQIQQISETTVSEPARL